MRKICLILAFVFIVIAAVGCGADETTTTLLDDTTTTTGKGGASQISRVYSVEDMAKLEGVQSVTKNEAESINNCLVYDIVLNLDGVILPVQMALPGSYSNENCPTVLYFPDVMLNYGYLRNGYASVGAIVLRVGYRSDDSDTQRRDFCGEDYKDVKALFEICKKCDFLTRGGMFTIGAAEGSVRALMLASDYPTDILGCAVVDTISDVKSFADARGEGVRQLIEYRIGATYEEKPEEYKRRSAVHFANRINVPVLILAYTEGVVPIEQAAMLRDSINNAGGSCEYKEINVLSGDFSQYALDKLYPWMVELLQYNN